MPGWRGHDRQVRCYEIFAGREYGEYIWNALWHTGEPFGIAAFGLKALAGLEAHV